MANIFRSINTDSWFIRNIYMNIPKYIILNHFRILYYGHNGASDHQIVD